MYEIEYQAQALLDIAKKGNVGGCVVLGNSENTTLTWVENRF